MEEKTATAQEVRPHDGEYPVAAASMSNALVSESLGVLWVVATPIGNLRDITLRALDVLGSVDWLAAEDTRRSKHLLSHYSLKVRTISLHEHNEARRLPRLLRLLESGYDIGLISDAGTPLLSDPGGRLVAAAQDMGARVIPVPGPSSVTAALAVAGFAIDGFVFEGFLPAKRAARRRVIDDLVERRRPSVMFEAPHRIRESLLDLLNACGEQRWVTVARELTKWHETIIRGPVKVVVERIEADSNQQRGEFVVIVSGQSVEHDLNESIKLDAEGILRSLLAELPVKQAARLAAQMTGGKRNKLYQKALEISQDGGAQS